MVQLTQVETENGQSRLADETQAQQFPGERAGEEVVIANPRGVLAGTGYRSAVSDLVGRLSSIPSVAALRSPLAAGNAGQISRNRPARRAVVDRLPGCSPPSGCSRCQVHRWFWAPIVGAVLRAPVLWGGAAAALLVALAIPAFSLHTVSAGMQRLPPNLQVMQAYQRVQQSFPGGAEPETVVISASNVAKPAITAGIVALEHRALATGQMHEPILVDVSASRQAARVSIPLVGTGTDAATLRALALLGDRVVPATIGRVPGVTVHTSGRSARTIQSYRPY